MIAHEHAAVRNVWLLLLVRGLLVAGGVAFAAVVPRLMGPAGYGQVALLVALSVLFSSFASLGFTQVLGRQVPGFVVSGDGEGLRRFFSRLMAVRLLCGVLAAALYAAVTIPWLRDLDPVAMLVLAVAIGVRAPAGLCFALFLGLNRAARWGLADIVRQWAMMAFMLPGYLLGGLRGAALGVLLAELTVFAVGFSGARPHLSWKELRIDLAALSPYLKFGLLFYAGDLVLAAFERSGEVLVRVMTGDYVQIGYFGVSYSVYLAAAVGVPQAALAFAPLLGMLRAHGEAGGVVEWVERLLAWLTAGAVFLAGGALLLAEDLVPLVLGEAYRAAVPNITVMAVSILALCLTSVANLTALVHDRPGLTLGAAVVRLVLLWAFGLVLVRAWGSLGACVAVALAMTGQATYFTVRVRRVVRYPLRRWARVLGAGLLVVPLIFVKGSAGVNVALFAGFATAYATLLVTLRLVTPREILTVWRALTSEKPAPSDGGGAS